MKSFFRTHHRKNRVIFITVIIVALTTMGCQEKVIISGKCGVWGGNATWQFSEEGVLRVKGNGPMVNFGVFDTHPWAHLRNKIKTVVIDQGISNIGAFAFEDCWELTSVSIPNSILIIDDCAFLCCGLSSLSIPNSVNKIGYRAFAACKLTSVFIPSSIINIETSAFEACPLTTVIIGNSNITIGVRVFDGRYLKSVICKGNNPPNIVTGNNSTFSNVPDDIPVYIPSGSLSAYQNSNWGKVFSNFIEE